MNAYDRLGSHSVVRQCLLNVRFGSLFGLKSDISRGPSCARSCRAGYSKDGKTIYIDRHMPSSFRYDGRDINTDRYLILHEEVEKTLIDQLNLHYLHAHQIATRAEQAAVRAAGVRWRDYDRFMQKYVKRIGDEQLTKVPADLDLKPYRDEHDYDLVQRMLASIARGQGPAGVKAKDVERAVGRYMPHVRDFKAKAKRKRQGLVR